MNVEDLHLVGFLVNAETGHPVVQWGDGLPWQDSRTQEIVPIDQTLVVIVNGDLDARVMVTIAHANVVRFFMARDELLHYTPDEVAASTIAAVLRASSCVGDMTLSGQMRAVYDHDVPPDVRDQYEAVRFEPLPWFMGVDLRKEVGRDADPS